MCVEDGIDVPSLLPTCNGYQGLVACLSPCPNILSSLLESSSQCIGCLLVEAVQRVAVHIVSHFRLVNVAGTRLLCVPKDLVCHLYTKHTNITVSQYLSVDLRKRVLLFSVDFRVFANMRTLISMTRVNNHTFTYAQH